MIFIQKKAEDGLILTDEEKEEAFNILDGYKIIYKGKEEKQLTSIEEYDTYYYDFEKWTILREDGSVVRKKKYKRYNRKSKNNCIRRTMEMY